MKWAQLGLGLVEEVTFEVESEGGEEGAEWGSGERAFRQRGQQAKRRPPGVCVCVNEEVAWLRVSES